MDRINRLTTFWNWLPAFRVVAETLHLPTASKTLHVAPSALSRTIHLLEEELGITLFIRKGRGLELSEEGRLFLQATRDSMRMLHNGLSNVQGEGVRGEVHISVPGPFAPIYAIPPINAVKERYPEITPVLHSFTSGDVNYKLRRGLIDIALQDDPVPDKNLVIKPLLKLHHDVFVASDQKPASVDEMTFAAPITDESGNTPDAWPLEKHREIGVRVTHMEVAIDAVKTGRYAAALPVPVGAMRGLKPLGIQKQLETTTLFMVHRPIIEGQGAISVVIEAILRQI